MLKLVDELASEPEFDGASAGERTVYDLASILLGGPCGRELRGEAFKRACAYVADVFGERNTGQTTEGGRAVRAQSKAAVSAESAPGAAVMDAVDAIADMAQRVKLNGVETTYASEKLSFVLYKSAEALALCGADIGEVITEACRGFRDGRSWADGEGDGR